MISPNRPVIMDATSTTSAYIAIETNAHTEFTRSDVSDSTDGLNENEPLELPSQDLEDEDTLSDDSLRLRLSDDEADASEARTMEVPTVPCVSTKQSAPQDTAMDLAGSDEKVTNEECQSPKHRSQILSETVGGEQNANSMLQGENHKEHSSIDTINSLKYCSRGDPLHVRYRHNQSNHNITYFNNQDNFGKPSGYRKFKNNWRHSREKYQHDNTKNMPTNAVTEQVSTIESESCSKSDMDTDPLVKSQSPVCPTDSIERTLSNVKADSEPALLVTTNRNDDSSTSVNDELSRECLHLNFDKEPTADSSDSLAPNRSNCADSETISEYSYDSNFTSDNWFSEPPLDIGKNMQYSQTSSALLNQGSSDIQGVESTSPVRNAESAVPSKEEIDTANDLPPLSESTNLSPLDLVKDTSELDISDKSNNANINSNDENDVTRSIHSDVEPNDLTCKATDNSDGISNSPVMPKACDSEIVWRQLDTAVADTTEMEISDHQGDSMDDAKEVKKDNQIDENCAEQPLNEKNAEDEKQNNVEEMHLPLVGQQEAAEQSMENVTESKETADNMKNEGEKSLTVDIEKKTSLDAILVEVANCAPQNSKPSKDIAEESWTDDLPCHELSHKSSDNSELNLTEKPTDTQPLLVTKRSLSDAESAANTSKHKKMKVTPDSEHRVSPKLFENLVKANSPDQEKKSTAADKCQETPKSLHYVRKFFQRDMKGKLSKLKREELEEFLIQKLVETITMRSEIGSLREQARISERNQEATRVRCQQLSKQIKDFDMVLSRNAVDRKANNDKPVPPIKINRSVGLQVNFVTDQGIQSLRALTVNNAAKTNSPTVVNGGTPKTSSEKTARNTAVRRGLKVRSPRRTDPSKSSPHSTHPQASTAMPTAIVVSKPVDTLHKLSVPNNNKEHALPNVNLAQPAAAKVQNIVVNGKITYPVNRQAAILNNQKQSNDLIDLTEEEDKSRCAPSLLPTIGNVTSSSGTKVPHPRFQRVVQATIPGNVAIATQSTNIRVVQSVSQPTPTALVNNVSSARLAYVMQGTSGPGRQLLIAPNPNQTRPVVSSTTRGQYSNLTYKSGVSTLANGNVRVITTAATTIPNPQLLPAPLPETPHYPAKNGWKLPPPPPSLKISKVTQGIVLSWNMAQSESYAEIVSYQLYAYQEIPGTPPNSNLWKKVGDVRALPLPMACTLKEFTPGNNYYFAVRAVDTHSRLGQYSIPRNISL